MKHKHYEVLLAIAEGKDVQFKTKDDRIWTTASINDSVRNPITHDYLEWRVKKEPVIEVRYFGQVIHNGTVSYSEIENDDQIWDLKITYQDGMPIKAELEE